MALTLDTRLVKVLGAKTAKAMEEQLGLQHRARPAAPLPAPLRQRGELTPLSDLQVGDGSPCWPRCAR